LAPYPSPHHTPTSLAGERIKTKKINGKIKINIAMGM